MLLKNFKFIVLFLSVILTSSQANECEENVKKKCKETLRNQCYYDRERTCFKHYNTNCEMELASCKNEKVYEIWPEKFCESLQFLCVEEIDAYNWPPDYFYQQIVHIRDNKTNPYEGMY